ncbi:MAG: glycosyltransferase family 1 protein [Bdellovibrionales bacterium]|nr:glycosyltransferase family 1 protein [Bdellovibrionales bacterium]
MNGKSPSRLLLDLLTKSRSRHLRRWYEYTIGRDLVFRFESTELRCYTIGLGDCMVAHQFGSAFLEHCRAQGDPRWGIVTLSGGSHPIVFHAPRTDRNIYWWWSMGRRAEWLSFYLEQTTVRPDVVLCLSPRCMAQAAEHGLQTLLLPLGVGAEFRALALPRRGVGFAGTRNHKDRRQVELLLTPAAQRADFEWSNPRRNKTAADLNRWYNTKRVILGMTEAVQQEWGMVNNRVFEVLASGTALLLPSHPSLAEVLQKPYPYQTASAEQTIELIETLLAKDADSYEEEFRDWSSLVLQHHTYRQRVQTLADFWEAHPR